MALISEVQALYGPMAGTVSRRQLRCSDAEWGGSRRQNSELTNRNRTVLEPQAIGTVSKGWSQFDGKCFVVIAGTVLVDGLQLE